MISTGSHTALHQFQETRLGAHGNGLSGEFTPDFIVIGQPGEKRLILHERNVAGQGLIEVMVGVDESGSDDHIRGINCVVCLNIKRV